LATHRWRQRQDTHRHPAGSWPCCGPRRLDHPRRSRNVPAGSDPPHDRRSDRLTIPPCGICRARGVTVTPGIGPRCPAGDPSVTVHAPSNLRRPARRGAPVLRVQGW